tara:strand:+ start:375 stop:611 length:237 start_codon:yes stop_codon:yes gene_type:complete
MKNLLVIAAVITLTGCTQLNSLQIEDGENAMACVKGNTTAASGLFGGNISGITVEVPSQVDTSNWTAEDWKTLAELCD